MLFAKTLSAQLDRWLDRFISVLGAIVAAQGPEFMQQYLQRLGGHLDEARRHLGEFERVAAKSGVSLSELVAETKRGGGAGAERLSEVIAGAASRVDALERAFSSLQGASAWARPFRFIQNLDTEIFHGTWRDYRPAVPTTGEGVIYAVAGVVVAVLLYYGGIRWPLGRWRNRRLAAKPSGSI